MVASMERRSDGDDATPAKDAAASSASVSNATVEDDSLRTQPGEGGSVAGAPSPTLGAGDTLGRYVVLSRLGVGAMGVVYAAFDPELDRKVALKIINSERSGADLTAGRQRLVREAQALARLSHPNVVSVHDVGTHDNQVYVAMEFVEGETLGSWRKRTRPGIKEVLRVFNSAGQGLAAAHRAGLVHRDFKPDNVILAEDGTVRVLDFGLARADEDEGPSVTASADLALPEDLKERLASTGGSLATDLTRTGGVLGTPAYMSPEQHLGLRVSARSDQFSYCVTLYEALYAERPFAGETLATLAFSVTQGRFRESSGAKVPWWIRRVLLKGLSPDPVRRYADMGALLAALADDPAVRRRKLLTRAAIVTLGVVAGWGVLEGGSGFAPCEGVAAPLEPVWSDRRRREVRAAFDATGLPFAPSSFDAAAGRLDGWATAWTDGRRGACEANRVRAEQSDDLLDRRMLCLDRGLGEAAALVERLVKATPEAVEKAVAAVEALPPPGDCADAEALLAGQPPLRGENRPAAEAIEEILARTRAAMGIGDYAGAMELVDGVWARATKLHDPLTAARVARTLADLASARGETEEAAKHLREAVVMADVAGNDRLRARTATSLVSTLGFKLARVDEAAIWERYAEGAIGRLGDPDPLRADLVVATGTVKAKAGDYDGAIDTLERGLARLRKAHGDDPSQLNYAQQRLAEIFREKGRFGEAATLQRELLAYHQKEVGPDHPRVATALSSLGNTLFSQGDYQGAADNFERGLEILARSFGEQNPRYFGQLNNYAAALLGLGETQEAEAIHRRILAYNEGRFGSEHLRLTPSLENLGNVLIAQNRFEEAQASLERSLAIRKKVHGPEHPSVAMSEMNLGVALFQMGKYEQVIPLYEHTKKVWTQRLGPTHSDLGLVETNLGDLAVALGKNSRAVKHFRKAIELLQPALGKDHADLGWPLTGIGMAKVAMGDRAGAREVLTRAMELRRGAELPDGELARMSWAYVRAVESENLELAKAAAAAAVDDARAGGDRELLAAMEAWLAGKR